MNKDVAFLVDLVKVASLLINDDIYIKAKGEEGDLVTNFDYEIEDYMIKKIKSSYPDFEIISEEFNEDGKLTENCFTIDPIDGTKNFANNIPMWGIQVACIKNFETCAAVIYLPKLDELYYADESGAYKNGEPIQVNCYPYDKGMYTVTAKEPVIGISKMRKINRNHCNYCASVNFAYVACGRLSGSIYRAESLWDYIPGQYLVKQAGGVIYNAKGSHIAANNEEFLEVLRKNASYDENEKVIITRSEKPDGGEVK